MELPLFSRDRDIRFVRPKRIAFLEWFRAIRHNLYCEFTLIADGARIKIHSFIEKFRNQDFLSHRLKVTSLSARCKEILNGRQAAHQVRRLFSKFREHGTAPAFWPLIFICGLLIGVGLKYLAEDTLTIGYRDYMLDNPQNLYDLNYLEEKFQTQSLTDTLPTRKTYPACTLQEF